jgi:hypothetical protein
MPDRCFDVKFRRVSMLDGVLSRGSSSMAHLILLPHDTIHNILLLASRLTREIGLLLFWRTPGIRHWIHSLRCFDHAVVSTRWVIASGNSSPLA